MWQCGREVVKEEHILDSIRISYSAYQSIEIQTMRSTSNERIFQIKFGEGEMNILTFTRVNVHSTPTHL